jgi:hypothetical protein
MSEKRFLVQLSEAERQHLMGAVKSERISVRKRTAAQVLLMIDQGEYGPSWTDAEAAEAYHCHPNHVTDLRRRLVVRGFEAVLERKAQVRPSRVRKLDAAGEKELIAIAQSDPPDGRVRWTLSLLAGQLVCLNVVEDSISRETVRRALKKTTLHRTAKMLG